MAAADRLTRARSGSQQAGKESGWAAFTRDVWGLRRAERRPSFAGTHPQVEAQLEPDPGRPAGLVTVRGVGYRLDA